MSNDLGRLLVVAGLILVALGALLWLGGKLPGTEKLALGRLPGDIRIERGDVRFYIPLTTCLLISLALTLVLWLVRRWRG
jgi:DUF2905 family protein